MTDFEKLQKVFQEIGVPFELTDDSEESDFDDLVDTVIIVKENDGFDTHRTAFFFRRDGSYKEVCVF